MALCSGEEQLSGSPLRSLFIIHKAFPQPGFICAPSAGVPPQANPSQASLQTDVHCTPYPLGQHMLKVQTQAIVLNIKKAVTTICYLSKNKVIEGPNKSGACIPEFVTFLFMSVCCNVLIFMQPFKLMLLSFLPAMIDFLLYNQ